jgi:hypothetical protein
MAVLTATEKAAIRNFAEAKALEAGVAIAYSKPAINAGAQAVEDYLVSKAAEIGAAIDAATQPLGVTFTAGQKKFLVAIVLYVKFLRDK